MHLASYTIIYCLLVYFGGDVIRNKKIYIVNYTPGNSAKQSKPRDERQHLQKVVPGPDMGGVSGRQPP